MGNCFSGERRFLISARCCFALNEGNRIMPFLLKPEEIVALGRIVGRNWAVHFTTETPDRRRSIVFASHTEFRLKILRGISMLEFALLQAAQAALTTGMSEAGILAGLDAISFHMFVEAFFSRPTRKAAVLFAAQVLHIESGDVTFVKTKRAFCELLNPKINSATLWGSSDWKALVRALLSVEVLSKYGRKVSIPADQEQYPDSDPEEQIRFLNEMLSGGNASSIGIDAFSIQAILADFIGRLFATRNIADANSKKPLPEADYPPVIMYSPSNKKTRVISKNKPKLEDFVVQEDNEESLMSPSSLYYKEQKGENNNSHGGESRYYTSEVQPSAEDEAEQAPSENKNNSNDKQVPSHSSSPRSGRQGNRSPKIDDSSTNLMFNKNDDDGSTNVKNPVNTIFDPSSSSTSKMINNDESEKIDETNMGVQDMLQDDKKDDLQFDSLNNVCLICFEELEGSECYAMPCKHFLHVECGAKWFQDHSTCPVCRRMLSSEPQDQVEESRASSNTTSFVHPGQGATSSGGYDNSSAPVVFLIAG